MEILLGAIDTYQEIQKVQLHNVLRCFSNHSFCLLLLFINQTQGNVTTLPRPMGREIKPVIQIQICKVSELSLFQMKKLHKHKDFFLYCMFFLILPPVFQVESEKPLGRIVVKALLCGMGSPPSC